MTDEERLKASIEQIYTFGGSQYTGWRVAVVKSIQKILLNLNEFYDELLPGLEQENTQQDIVHCQIRIGWFYEAVSSIKTHGVNIEGASAPLFLELSNRNVTDIKERKMGRKKKHPEHNPEQLMNELLTNLIQVWTTEKEPELKAVSAELEMSPAKVRKLLITAGERDHTTYFQSSTADQVKRMKTEGLSLAEIQEITGLSYTSVQGYLPHKHIYNLETISAENERIRLYRARKAAVEELHALLDLPDATLYLWRCVIAFEGYTFSTSGRGKKPGVKFKYSVSRERGNSGRKYGGTSVEGFGNEMWITTDGAEKKKSISRSTVDLAYKNARRGLITGPKKLGVPGADSYLFPVFVRFGLV